MRRTRLIFDLDDTLYAERDFAISGFRAAGLWAKLALDVDGLADDMTRLLDAGHLGVLFRLVLEERGLDVAHAPNLIGVYREHTPQSLTLYPDAARALTHWSASGPTGLITDGTVAVQRSKVKALAIDHHFDHIIYTHELGGRDFAKPHPKAFETMQAAIGSSGDRFVYVGDNPAKDFVSPNRMGWTTVQIKRPQRIHAAAEMAQDGAPHFVIDSLDQLPELLGR